MSFLITINLEKKIEFSFLNRGEDCKQIHLSCGNVLLGTIKFKRGFKLKDLESSLSSLSTLDKIKIALDKCAYQYALVVINLESNKKAYRKSIY